MTFGVGVNPGPQRSGVVPPLSSSHASLLTFPLWPSQFPFVFLSLKLFDPRLRLPHLPGWGQRWGGGGGEGGPGKPGGWPGNVPCSLTAVRRTTPGDRETAPVLGQSTRGGAHTRHTELYVVQRDPVVVPPVVPHHQPPEPRGRRREHELLKVAAQLVDPLPFQDRRPGAPGAAGGLKLEPLEGGCPGAQGRGCGGGQPDECGGWRAREGEGQGCIRREDLTGGLSSG